MKKLFLISNWMFVSYSLLIGAENPLYEEAALYYQAKDFGKAEQLFEQLLSQVTKPWQKAIVQYDLGTNALQAGEIEKALKYFQNTPLGPNPFPLILYRLRTNEAISRYKQIKQAIKKIDEKDEWNKQNHRILMKHFRILFYLIDQAENAGCNLQKLEGSELCIPSIRLQSLRQTAQNLKALLIAHSHKKELQRLSFEELILALLTAEAAFQNSLNQLEGVQNLPILDQHLDRIANAAKSWESVWEKLITLSLKNDKYSLLVKKGSDKYNSFIGFIENKEVGKAKEALKESKQPLREILGKTVGVSPFAEAIYILLEGYKKILEQGSIRDADISSLLAAQKETFSLVKEETKVDQELLDSATKELENAYDNIREGNVLYGRFYLILAEFDVIQIIWSFTETYKDKPDKILELLIDLQDNVHLLTRTSISIIEVPKKQVPFESLIRAQKDVIGKVQFFDDAVLNYQKKEFDSFDQVSPRCQFMPWSLVYPPFNSGTEKIIQAEKLLENKPESLTDTLFLLESSLIDWQKALEILQNPPEKAVSCTEKKEEEEAGGEKGDQEAPKEEEKESIDNVLRLLQEMEQDDNKFKLMQKIPEKTEGAKPW